MAGTDTLLLDNDTWDLVLDASNNIAVASAPYSLAQDAASAARTFLGEVYWDTTIGVPYLTQILGKRPPLALLKAQLMAAAASVPGVASAKCFISTFTSRGVGGQIQVKPVTGGPAAAVNFQVIDPQGA